MDNVPLDAVDDALARAVVFRALSLALQPPNDDRLRQMGASDGFGDVVAALRWLDCRAGGSGLEAVATQLAAMSPLPVEPVTERFVHLFGHTTRGLVCACETEYGPDNGFHQPQQLADIAGYYLAFGLRPIAGSDTRVDHIACECEFMDFLNRKEAVLLAGETRSAHAGETLEVTQHAARGFLREHLARFGCAFATRLADKDHDGYYGAVGRMLLAFLKTDCARLGIGAGPTDLAVRSEMVDDAPMACGTADELIQIQRPRGSGVGRRGPPERPSRGSEQSPDSS